VFCAHAGILIEFGDGARSGVGEAPSGACPAGQTSYVTRTYTTPGMYQLPAIPCPLGAMPFAGRSGSKCGDHNRDP
jgi:hypothetical protein